MRARLLRATLAAALLLGTAARAQETVLPLTAADWERRSCGAIAEMADGSGLSLWGADYRSGNGAVSRATFDFTRGSDTYVRFMPTDWNYSYFGAGIDGVVGIGGTTSHSFMGSVVLWTNAWHFVRIRIEPDRSYAVVLSRGDYDTNGGAPILSYAGTLDDVAWAHAAVGQLVANFGDNYGGTSTQIIVGEARTNAVPVAVATGSSYTYAFDDGAIPPEFVTVGPWTAADGTLSLTTSGNQTATAGVDFLNAARVSFKVRTEFPLRSWGWDNRLDAGVLAAVDGSWVEGGLWMTTPAQACWLEQTWNLPAMGPQRLEFTYSESNYYSGYPSAEPHRLAIDEITITCRADAVETKHDGIDQDCNGYDLTIEVVSAVYSKSKRTLTVNATSTLGAAAALSLSGYGPMTWQAKQGRWTATARDVPACPAEATVSGVEGETSAPVTCSR